MAVRLTAGAIASLLSGRRAADDGVSAAVVPLKLRHSRMEMTMKLRLMVAVGLLALVGACSAGPYSRTPAYYDGSYNNGYNGNNG